MGRLIPVLACVLCVVAAGARNADAAEVFPGEALVVEGIRKQDRERKQDVALDGLVQRYEQMAVRRAEGAEKLRRLYLLARAYGLRHGDLRSKAAEAKDASDVARLEAAAAKDYAAAMSAYQDVLRVSRRCYFAYHDMGVIALQAATDRRDVAAQYLRRAWQLKPSYTAPLRQLTLLYMTDRNWREAIPVLRELIRIEPDDVKARAALIEAHTQLKQFDEAHRRIDAELAKAAPNSPTDHVFRLLQAGVHLAAQDTDRALELYKQLVIDLPAHPQPLQGYMRCLVVREKLKQPVHPDDMLWVLQRMYRRATSDEEKKDIRAKIDELKAQIANFSDQPARDLTEEEKIIALMTGKDEDLRFKVMTFITMLAQPPPRPVWSTVLKRITAAGEPSGRVRAQAVRAIGVHGGFALMPVLRLVLAQDADRRVRLAAVDAVLKQGELSVDARDAGVLILARHVDDKDRQVAAEIRFALLQSAKGRLAIDRADSTDAQHRAAFLEWWNGPVGSEARIRGLRAYPALMDVHVQDVLLPYVSSSSFFEMRAAYRAFGTIQAQFSDPSRERLYRSRNPEFAAWKTWLFALPVIGAGEMQQANHAALRARLEQWAKEKP